MKKFLGSVVIGSSVFLTACVPGNHVYSPAGACVTCMNNPATGEPLNYDPKVTPMFKSGSVSEARTSVGVSESRSTKNGATTGNFFSGQFTMNSNRDVDSVYGMMRSNFGFRTEQQMSRTNSGEWGMKSDAWRHEMVPGAFYNLSDYARVSVDGVSTSFVMSVKIVKNRSGSIVTVGYESTRGSKPKLASSLQRKVKVLLK
jgi:hypothetical protein